MKFVKLKQTLTVVFNDGTTFVEQNCRDDLYEQLLSLQNDEDAVKELLLPNFFNKKKEAIELDNKADLYCKDSQYLERKGNIIVWTEVSEIPLPFDLAEKIYNAEQNQDYNLLESYKNFWILTCLNPDSRVRNNLFWFLNKYGMTISKSGLFVAYRNVEKLQQQSSNFEEAKEISKAYVKIKFKWKKNPKKYTLIFNVEDNKFEIVKISKMGDSWDTNKLKNLSQLYSELSEEKGEKEVVFTDSYTKSFKIKIGKPVYMKRGECDTIQENTCSKGLHCSSKKWLEAQGPNYFGTTSLVVLVNPRDVVAVPPVDSYGKLRTCSYFPVSICERDEKGKIITESFNSDGFEDDFADYITYTGEFSGEDEFFQKKLTHIPDIPELSFNNVVTNLESLALKMRNKLI